MNNESGCMRSIEVTLIFLAFVLSLITVSIAECHRRGDNRRQTLPLLVVETTHSELQADMLGVKRQDVCVIKNVGPGVALYIHVEWEVDGLESRPLCPDVHHASKDGTVKVDICPSYVIGVGKRPVDLFVSETTRETNGWLKITADTENQEKVITKTAFRATYDPAQSNTVYLRFGKFEILQR